MAKKKNTAPPKKPMPPKKGGMMPGMPMKKGCK